MHLREMKRFLPYAGGKDRIDLDWQPLKHGPDPRPFVGGDPTSARSGDQDVAYLDRPERRNERSIKASPSRSTAAFA